jgi:hypothetical protein
VGIQWLDRVFIDVVVVLNEFELFIEEFQFIVEQLTEHLDPVRDFPHLLYLHNFLHFVDKEGANFQHTVLQLFEIPFSNIVYNFLLLSAFDYEYMRNDTPIVLVRNTVFFVHHGATFQLAFNEKILRFWEG